MFIVALNCGSSSVKTAVLDGTPLRRVWDARIEQIGTSTATLRVGKEARAIEAPDIEPAVDALLAEIERQIGERRIEAFVHRVVHGGERFTRPTRMDATALDALDALSALAPLHNPPAVVAIRAARTMFAHIPHYAVFDTSFHATLPPYAREYALPKELRQRYGIRRFGFHGISHEHVMQRAATLLGRPARDLRIVSCHLGNGASVAAIEHGESVQTSMGMTPLEGLVMGTRAGDLDPGVLLELMRDYDRTALERLLTRKSGLLGMTGTNDVREIERRAGEGDPECRLALDVYTARIRAYIGAYAATMGGVDAIAFTGGVGENSAYVRQRCLQRLAFLGVSLDEARNRAALTDPSQECAELTAPGSPVRLLALRADEELAMAEAVFPARAG